MHQLIGKRNKIIIYLLFLFILSTTNGKFVKNKNSSTFSVNQINVEGLSNNYNLKIFKELNNLFYKNILLIKKEEVKKTISKHNIIGEYNVKKIYPSTINIKIKPTKLIARTSNDNQLLVGANGKLIENRENNMKLPYIFGEFSSDDFLNFQKDISESKFIITKFKTLYFFPSNRWDILTDNDILIKLPQNNIFNSLNLAYKVINSKDMKNINLIDLRITNHLIMK